jgi:hypothetical protein
MISVSSPPLFELLPQPLLKDSPGIPVRIENPLDPKEPNLPRKEVEIPDLPMFTPAPPPSGILL